MSYLGVLVAAFLAFAVLAQFVEARIRDHVPADVESAAPVACDMVVREGDSLDSGD